MTLKNEIGGCCDNCLGVFWGKGHCKNPACRCHRPTTEKWKCIEHKGQLGTAYLDCEFCKPPTTEKRLHTDSCLVRKNHGTCMCECHHPTTHTSDWRERFENAFHQDKDLNDRVNGWLARNNGDGTVNFTPDEWAKIIPLITEIVRQIEEINASANSNLLSTPNQ